MNNSKIDFSARFETKVANNNADMSMFVDGNDDDWYKLLTYLENDPMDITEDDSNSFDFDDSDEDGYITSLMALYNHEGYTDKEVIAMVLDNVVDNIEATVDTVDVFHLISAHRDMLSLSDTVPFELAEMVGYTYDEYVDMCDDVDERINEILEIAINQMIGAVAADNECI